MILAGAPRSGPSKKHRTPVKSINEVTEMGPKWGIAVFLSDW